MQCHDSGLFSAEQGKLTIDIIINPKKSASCLGENVQLSIWKIPLLLIIFIKNKYFLLIIIILNKFSNFLLNRLWLYKILMFIDNVIGTSVLP